MAFARRTPWRWECVAALSRDQVEHQLSGTGGGQHAPRPNCHVMPSPIQSLVMESVLRDMAKEMQKLRGGHRAWGQSPRFGYFG
jgi:hypothetical protein